MEFVERISEVLRVGDEELLWGELVKLASISNRPDGRLCGLKHFGA